jgi:DNA-binding NarL/FixJ family response regulator
VLPVAVIDPLPLFRQGAAMALSAAGHTVEDPLDVLSWAAARHPAVIVLTLIGSPDWELLAGLRNSPDVGVVAVLQDLHPAALRAIRLGARSVLARTAGPGALIRTVEATADGQAVVPADVLAELSGARQTASHGPSEQELAWLRVLAGGATVAELAVVAGYSERAMYRLLKKLYRDLGVSSKMQAVLRARELGWLPASIGGS